MASAVNAPTSALHLAIAYGEIHVVDVLAKYVDVNEREAHLGRTPLHMAVKWDNFPMTRILLENAARVNDASHDNLTALHIAVANRSPPMVALLLKSGADADPEVKFCGKTPLYMAVEHNCPKIVDMLLTAGASIQNAATPNSTLFDVAERTGASTVRNMLISFERVKFLCDIIDKDISKERIPKVKMMMCKHHIKNRFAPYSRRI